MNEEKTTGESETTTTEDVGVQSETAKETERIHAETEGLNKAIAEKENADARAKIAGVAPGADQEVEKKIETPAEYAARVMKGEV